MKQKRKKKKKIIRLFIGLLLLAFVMIGLFIALRVKQTLNKINYTDTSEGEITVNPEVEQDETLSGYTTIALFGIDTRDGNMEHANSDSIILMNLNHEEKTINMVSVYRDTFLDVGDGDYRKCNAAYQKGGPEQAVSMLNQNLDLNISKYISVDFNAVSELVDALGGIELELSDEEAHWVNYYCVETSKVTGKSYTKIQPETAGTYTLNGVQAVSYARIRYTAGNDMKRTERQRTIIRLVADKLKVSSKQEILQIMDQVLPYVKTNFTQTELLSLGLPIISYSFNTSEGFPFELTSLKIASKGDCLLPDTLEQNVVELHQLLFLDDTYVVSELVKEKSSVIETYNPD